MSDSDFDPNAAAGEIVKEALNSELVKDLLGPMVKNMGMVFGQISDIARFYTEDNLAKIFKKWATQRRGIPLDAEAFRRVLPLLRDAAMQSDDELQERWASLMENVATAADGVLPSFGQVLSQLTPAEARYLDRIWERVSALTDYNSGKRKGRDDMSFSNLVDIYKPKMRAPSPAEMNAYRSRMSAEQIAAFDEMTSFELMLHDLERLNLLEKKMVYTPGRMMWVETEIAEVPAGHSEGGTKTTYALTQYGVSFILAVRPKQTY
jgi:hypothetical protein